MNTSKRSRREVLLKDHRLLVMVCAPNLVACKCGKPVGSRFSHRQHVQSLLKEANLSRVRENPQR